MRGIEGRIQDYVVSRDGRLVPLTPAIFNYDEVDWSGVHRFQIVQEAIGELLVKIVIKRDTPVGETELSQRIPTQLASVLPGGFKIEVEFVSDISRTQRGKYKYLDQRLELNQYFRGTNVV